MILDALFRFFADIVNWIMGLLPAVPTIDLSSWSAASGVFSWMRWANTYVPLDQAAAVIAIYLTVWVVFYALDLVEWALTKMHILGGSS